MKKFCVLCLCVFAVMPLFADPPFSGTYTASFVRNGSPVTWRITFRGASACVLQAAALVNGREVSQETEGSYSWDKTFLRINAVFRNPRIPDIGRVQWSSVVSFNGDNSFNILVTPDSSGGASVRMTFTKEDISFSVSAVAEAFSTLSQNIPLASRVAVVSIASNNADEATYYIDEVTLLFVNLRKFTIVDRTSIDVVLAEQNFQMSDLVDDNSAVSIGKFLGATVVVTGNISGTGAWKRLVLKALDVGTAEILAMSQASL
jgi:hypothetical protein